MLYALCFMLLALSGNACAHRAEITYDFLNSAQKLLTLFPAPQTGMLRKVINLPKKANEDNYQIELMIGKVKRVDCNRYMLRGKLETRILSEWGYTYLIVNTLFDTDPAIIPCMQGDVDIKFITAELGAGTMQPYNSQRPLVIYVPEGLDVRYRVWKLDEVSSEAEEL